MRKHFWWQLHARHCPRLATINFVPRFCRRWPSHDVDRTVHCHSVGAARAVDPLPADGHSTPTPGWYGARRCLQGGASADGWLYESRDRTVGVWGAIHKCRTAKGMVKVTTPQDGGPKNLACWDYQGCEQRVRRCMYDGGHGDWPDQPRADELVWAFFMQHMKS